MIQHFYGGGNKAPASLTNSLIRATRSDLIVIGHINIKNELSPLWLKSARGKRLPVLRLYPASAEERCISSMDILLRYIEGQSQNVMEYAWQ